MLNQPLLLVPTAKNYLGTLWPPNHPSQQQGCLFNLVPDWGVKFCTRILRNPEKGWKNWKAFCWVCFLLTWKPCKTLVTEAALKDKNPFSSLFLNESVFHVISSWNALVKNNWACWSWSFVCHVGIQIFCSDWWFVKKKKNHFYCILVMGSLCFCPSTEGHNFIKCFWQKQTKLWTILVWQNSFETWKWK